MFSYYNFYSEKLFFYSIIIIFLDFKMQNGDLPKNNASTTSKITPKFVDSFFSNANSKEMNGFSLHNQSYSMEFNDSNNYQHRASNNLPSNQVLNFFLN